MSSSIAFDIIARDKASATFSKVGRSADTTTGKLGKFGKLAGLSLGGIGLAAGALAKTSIGLEASFSKTMTQIGASTDGAGSHMSELNKLAMKMGAETSFSANEAAGAMLELGKSGINASDIMGGALSGTLTLAAAGSLDLGDAATIAANAMNTFGLKGTDMASIAAALAGGANASSASVESLGQALQQVGPGATNAGLSLQETVGALSAFDAAGIKGSDAGTSLKTMLSRLVPQTDAARGAMRKLGLDFTDAQGNFVPITNVAQQLKDKLSSLSEEQRTTALATIFGSDATRAATVLMKEGAKGLEGYIKATKDQAAAERLAKANMSGTAGALDRLQGSIETAQLALGKALAPAIQDVADFLSEDAVPAITGFIQGMQDGTGAGGDLAAVIGELATVAKTAVKFVDGLPGPVKKIGVEGLVAYLAMRKLTGVTAGIGPALASPIARTKQFAAEMTYAETRMQKVSTVSRKLGAGMRQLGGAAGMMAMADGAKRGNKALGALEMTAGAAAVGFAVGGPLGAGIAGTGAGLYSLLKATESSTKATKISLPSWKEYGQTLDGVAASTTRATRAMVLERLEKSGLLTATRRLGLSDREAVQAMTGNIAARKKLANALQNGKVLTDSQRQALEKETGAVGAARLKQLQHNVAIAGNAHELKLAKEALRKFMAAPAAKRVRITGIEGKAAQIDSITRSLRTLFSTKSDGVKVSGPGGYEVLINPQARANGGPVTAGQPYIVGERRAELFVPDSNGRIVPSVPTSASGEQSIEVHIHLEGETIVRSVKARNRNKGVTTAGL